MGRRREVEKLQDEDAEPWSDVRVVEDDEIDEWKGITTVLSSAVVRSVPTGELEEQVSSSNIWIFDYHIRRRQ